jgi:hypothetical protein
MVERERVRLGDVCGVKLEKIETVNEKNPKIEADRDFA